MAFADEVGIADDAVKAGFQFGQGLGKGRMADAAAVLAEVAVLIGKDEGVELLLNHVYSC